MKINISIRMDADAGGRDPDSYSLQLATYHQQLWSKETPSGEKFQLKIVGRKKFRLVYQDKETIRSFTSDSIIHTMSRWTRMKPIVESIESSKINNFFALANTIGGYIIFPSQRVNRKPTINGIRGLHPKIRDRFDLTLECIRLFYEEQPSPLYEHLKRYRWFFEYFVDFKGYITFFFLQDLLDDYQQIKFWLPFESFDEYVVIPRNKEEYVHYMKNLIDFVEKRNRRIEHEKRKEAF
jgi:hypothetical protein